MNMKTKTLRTLSLVLALTAGLFTARTLVAAEKHDHQNHKDTDASAKGTLAPADAKTDAAWLTKARAAYPMDSCVVSDEKLEGGAMGKPQEYVYQVAGQPDRLVRFCCKDCVNDFKKDPAQYLKKIDAAAAAKMKGAQK
jgi:hypothetical protein